MRRTSRWGTKSLRPASARSGSSSSDRPQRDRREPCVPARSSARASRASPTDGSDAACSRLCDAVESGVADDSATLVRDPVVLPDGEAGPGPPVAEVVERHLGDAERTAAANVEKLIDAVQVVPASRRGSRSRGTVLGAAKAPASRLGRSVANVPAAFMLDLQLDICGGGGADPGRVEHRLVAPGRRLLPRPVPGRRPCAAGARRARGRRLAGTAGAARPGRSGAARQVAARRRARSGGSARGGAALFAGELGALDGSGVVGNDLARSGLVRRRPVVVDLLRLRRPPPAQHLRRGLRRRLPVSVPACARASP